MRKAFKLRKTSLSEAQSAKSAREEITILIADQNGGGSRQVSSSNANRRFAICTLKIEQRIVRELVNENEFNDDINVRV